MIDDFSLSDQVTVTVICPSKGWISLNLRDLCEYRELLYFLTWRDIKVRYKQTVLGAAVAVGLLVSGTFYFRRMEKTFADVV
jgi:ABC-type polysaccharide/polyol phosphate export permease